MEEILINTTDIIAQYVRDPTPARLLVLEECLRNNVQYLRNKKLI